MKIKGTNISMLRGDTAAITVSVTDPAGASVPLEAGDIVYLTLKKSVDTEAKVLQKVVTDFIDGTALIELAPGDTNDIKPGIYMYDIQLTRANGKVYTIVGPSNWTIEGDVTRD